MEKISRQLLPVNPNPAPSIVTPSVVCTFYQAENLIEKKVQRILFFLFLDDRQRQCISYYYIASIHRSSTSIESYSWASKESVERYVNEFTLMIFVRMID